MRGDGLVEQLLFPEGVPQVVVGAGVLRVEPDRLTVFRDGLLQVPLGAEVGTQVGATGGVVRLESDCLAVFRDGLAALLRQAVAAFMPEAIPAGPVR